MFWVSQKTSLFKLLCFSKKAGYLMKVIYKRMPNLNLRMFSFLYLHALSFCNYSTFLKNGIPELLAYDNLRSF